MCLYTVQRIFTSEIHCRMDLIFIPIDGECIRERIIHSVVGGTPYYLSIHTHTHTYIHIYIYIYIYIYWTLD